MLARRRPSGLFRRPTMLSPREVIEDIRKTKYGVGLPPGSPQRVGFDALRPDLDRAMKDLYAEDVHFVLELVQNADDNRYRPDVTPFIRFVRSRDRLLVENNEVGFEEPNVRALCSIGRSTKRKPAIGEIKALIRRKAEYDADPTAPLPQTTMSDFLAL
jgi:hypothetical protein